MKLWRSTLLASVIGAKYGKSSEDRLDSCQSEETLRWKNEMKIWKKDQESKFSRFFCINEYSLSQIF